MPEQTHIPLRAGDSGGERPAESRPYERVDGAGQRWHCRPELAAALLPAGRWPLDRWESEGRVVRVKSGSHRTVYRVDSPAGVLYAKQYRVVGWPQRLLHLVRKPAAQREWDSILAVAEAGVPTVEPVAWGVVRRGPWVEESWLIAREIADVVPLDELTDCLATHRSATGSVRRKLARAAGRLLGSLHAAGFRHHDLHAGNLLVRDDAGEPALWLIDLHQVRRGEFDRDGAARNLALFDHFFLGHATAADRLRFFHAWWDAYHTGGPTRGNADDSDAAFRDAARRTEEFCRGAESAAYRRRDRKWRRGNRRLIVADRPGVVCRGLAFLGRDSLVAWRDAPESLVNAARAASDGTPVPLTVGTASISVELRVMPQLQAGRSAGLGSTTDGPAFQAWEMGHALARRGIAAVRPLFCVDRTASGGSAILALPSEPSSPRDTRPTTRRLTRNDATDRALVRRLADLMRRLHASGFVHDGLSLEALRVRSTCADIAAESVATSSAPATEIVLDALHAVRHLDPLSRSQVVEQLASLVLNIADPIGIGRTARWRFLARYVDGGRSWRGPKSDVARRRADCRRLGRETTALIASIRSESSGRSTTQTNQRTTTDGAIGMSPMPGHQKHDDSIDERSRRAA